MATQEALIKRFAEANLKLKITERSEARRDRIFGGGLNRFAISIGDRGGSKEHFSIVWGDNVYNIEALGIDARTRHVVLFVETRSPAMVREFKKDGKWEKRAEIPKDTGTVRRFLCGYDEREYFIAALPSSSNATSVQAAFRDLKPGPVKIDGGRQSGVLRQGEWFFIPQKNFDPTKHLIHRWEPMVRAGGGKPHMAEQLIRTEGKTVTFRKGEVMPNGRVAPRDTSMSEVGAVYVTGKVRHPDHKTKELHGWYKVLANTETSHDGSVMRFFD